MKQSDDDDLHERVVKMIQMSYIPNKQMLNLSDCARICVHVIKVMDWSMLKLLNLSMCQLYDLDILMLCNKKWASLQELNLQNNNISNDGAVSLCSIEWPKLKILNIKQNKIGCKGIFAILTKQFNNLCQLLLQNNHSLPQMTTKINVPPNVDTQIKILNLSLTNIGSQTTKSFMFIKFYQLHELSLANCNMGSEGIKQIIKARLPHLEKIDIGTNRIGLDGFQMIGKSKWTRLEQIKSGDKKKRKVWMSQFIWIEQPIKKRNSSKNKLSGHMAYLRQVYDN